MLELTSNLVSMSSLSGCQDDDVYTPLERPANLNVHNPPLAPVIESESDDSPSSSDTDSSSGPSAKRSKVSSRDLLIDL